MTSAMQKARQSLTKELKDVGLLVSKGFIGGDWEAAASGEEFPVVDPATGSDVEYVPAMGKVDAERAVSSAVKAFPSWKAKTMQERARVLSKWSDLIAENAPHLATLMCLESGKPKAESRGEVNYARSFVDLYKGVQANGLVLPQQTNKHMLLATKEPVGVCSLLTPWNFPAAMFTRKAAPALAAGCTVTIKPAEDTPLTTIALARLWEKAGGPAGTVNVVPTSRELVKGVGGVLSSHPDVRKISFTGSTAVGKQLLKQAAETVKRASMELGGNAPFVVFNDADVDLAVAGAAAAKFRFAGQTCISPNRFMVQAGVHDEFVAKLAEKLRGLKVGDGLDSRTTIGPLINAAAREKVATFVEDALSKGAEAIVGGDLEHDLGPNFFAPALLSACSLDMRLSHEEIFGPVVGVMRFDDEDEALAMSNRSRSGLAGYLYTQDYSQALRVAQALEVGMVGINETAISSAVIPFGGVKESGMGREGSVLGLDEYMEVKHICLGGL